MVNLLTSIPGEAADQPLGPLFIVGWLRQDARFDMVRTTPRFQRLLAQLWPPS